MSKECQYCKADNADSAVECEGCGNKFINIEPEKSLCVWKIKCPVCDHEYDVADKNSRIKICGNCDDEQDKLEIAQERPKRYEILIESEKNFVIEEETVIAKETKSPVLIMTHTSGKVIKINGNCTIGRGGDVEPEFFTDNNRFVSEFHCKVFFENGVYKIEHLGKNPTKIDDVIVSKGMRMELRSGNRLTIADRKFEISFSTDEAEQE